MTHCSDDTRSAVDKDSTTNHFTVNTINPSYQHYHPTTIIIIIILTPTTATTKHSNYFTHFVVITIRTLEYNRRILHTVFVSGTVFRFLVKCGPVIKLTKQLHPRCHSVNRSIPSLMYHWGIMNLLLSRLLFRWNAWH